MRLPLDRPAYGGDWNPEQWDAATVAEDIALMREAGVNLVSLGIFSWTFLEPEEGRHDLEWLAGLVDQLHEAGIKVDLATGTASPPAWMAADHPESLPVDARGVRLGFGSRQQYCPSSAIYRERSLALVEALATRFGNHPGVVLWHVDNEYGCHTRECFCQACVHRFRLWLQDRHGDVEALNRAWGTAFWSQRYTSFAQVGAPGAMPTFHNPAQMLDWRRFCNDQLLSLMTAQIEVLRRHSDRPVTTNFMGDFPYVDYRAWAEHVDLISEDSYPDPADPASAHQVAWMGDLMRGLGGGKPWLLMEQSPGAVQWREANSPKRPGQFLLWSIARMAHGADGIMQFQWRQSVAGAETFHSGMVPHAGTDSRLWTDMVAAGQVLARLAPVMGSRTQARVAVIMDWESQWARGAAIGPVTPAPFARARAWHRTLWEAGLALDVIGPADEVDAYDLIIVPEIFIDRPDLAARLESAVCERGAHVLVEGPSGVVDENLRALQGGYLGSLRSLLGVRVMDQAPLTGGNLGFGSAEDTRGAAVNRITRAVAVPSEATWAGLSAQTVGLRRALDRLGSPAPDLRADRWLEELAPLPGSTWDEVEVCASYDGREGGRDLAGFPAITCKRFAGGGGAWYAACYLDALSRRALADLLVAHARVRPVKDGLPDGVEAARRGRFLFLLNHGDAAVELSGVVGTDLVSASSCSGHVMLAPRSAMVVDEGA